MRLVEELADIDQPITSSQEGLDDACFFCHVWPKGIVDWERFAEHEASCLWVRARQAVGRDLGLHLLKPNRP